MCKQGWQALQTCPSNAKLKWNASAHHISNPISRGGGLTRQICLLSILSTYHCRLPSEWPIKHCKLAKHELTIKTVQHCKTEIRAFMSNASEKIPNEEDLWRHGAESQANAICEAFDYLSLALAFRALERSSMYAWFTLQDSTYTTVCAFQILVWHDFLLMTQNF